MTSEEAAEVILKGEAWKQCSGCAASGRVTIEYSGGRSRMCRICNGTTLELRPDYAEACRTLGRPNPERPDVFTIRDASAYWTTWPPIPFTDPVIQKVVEFHADYPIQKKDPDER